MSSERTSASGQRRPGSGITLVDGQLTRMRIRRGWDRARLARETGLSISMITKIENGERRPRPDKFSDICTALDCEPDELLPELPEPQQGEQDD